MTGFPWPIELAVLVAGIVLMFGVWYGGGRRPLLAVAAPLLRRGRHARTAR
jgi:hypothetical protein